MLIVKNPDFFKELTKAGATGLSTCTAASTVTSLLSTSSPPQSVSNVLCSCGHRSASKDVRHLCPSCGGELLFIGEVWSPACFTLQISGTVEMSVKTSSKNKQIECSALTVALTITPINSKKSEINLEVKRSPMWMLRLTSKEAEIKKYDIATLNKTTLCKVGNRADAPIDMSKVDKLVSGFDAYYHSGKFTSKNINTPPFLLSHIKAFYNYPSVFTPDNVKDFTPVLYRLIESNVMTKYSIRDHSLTLEQIMEAFSVPASLKHLYNLVVEYCFLTPLRNSYSAKEVEDFTYTYFGKALAEGIESGIITWHTFLVVAASYQNLFKHRTLLHGKDMTFLDEEIDSFEPFFREAIKYCRKSANNVPSILTNWARLMEVYREQGISPNAENVRIKNALCQINKLRYSTNDPIDIEAGIIKDPIGLIIAMNKNNASIKN